MRSRVFLRFAVVAGLCCAVSGGQAQSLDQAMGNALSEALAANARTEAELTKMWAYRTRLSGVLSMSGCDCDTPKGPCSADAILIEGPERSELVITASVTKPMCVRVGTYITTQWDLDNGTPAYQEFDYLLEPEQREWLEHADWNGRKPVLLDDVSCRLCATGVSLFCEESADAQSIYGPMAMANRQAAQQMEAPVSQMRASGMMVELTNSMERQKDLLYQVADEADKILELVQRGRPTHCQ